MKLHAKTFGHAEQPPLVILHGLFGSMDNWAGQSKALAEHFQVWTLDLRNHGRSGWDKRVDYPSMSADLLQFLDQHGLDQVLLMGHSMGGKVAMQFALDHPERLSKLIVVDIAPVQYPAHHTQVFAGLNSIDLTQLQSRRDADTLLQAHIDDISVRNFLLKNLYREGDGFAWRMNLVALEQGYDGIAAAITPPQQSPGFSGPTLFIKGEQSDYIQPQYRDAIAALFPQAEARIMSGVGHWPHAEKPKAFNALIKRFLL